MIKISCRYAAHVVLSRVFFRVMPGAEWLGGGQSPRGFYSDFLLEQTLPEDLTLLLQEEWKRVVKEGLVFRSLEMMSHNLAALWKSQGRFTAAAAALAAPNELVSVLQCGESVGLAPLPHLLDADEIGEVAILEAFFVVRELPERGDLRVLRVTGEVFEDVKEKKKYVKALAALKKQGDGTSRAQRFGFLEKDHERWIWRRGGVLLRQKLIQWWWDTHSEAGYDLFQATGEEFEGRAEYPAVSGKSLAAPTSLAQIGPFFDEGAQEHLGIYEPRWTEKDEACVFCCQKDLATWIGSSLQRIESMVRLFGLQTFSTLLEPKANFVETSKLSSSQLLAAAEKRESGGKVWRLEVCFLDALGARWPGAFVEVAALPGAKGQVERGFCVRHALFGSLDRLMALLLERPLPLWLAPCQVLILPLRAADQEQALRHAHRLRGEGIRTQIEFSSAPLGERLSGAFSREIPVIGILGPKEQKKGVLTLSFYGEEGELSVTVEELVKILKHKQSTFLSIEQTL